jgi:tetratricopeptide (TPR) repeat protein
MKTGKIVLLLVGLLACYYVAFSQLKSQREAFLQHSFVDYTLPSQFVGPMSLEFKGLMSDFLLFKFMTFIGGRVQDINQFDEKYWTFIEDSLERITDLDPYFWDAYLFAEMFLTWQGQRYEAANALLLKAKEYRTDDYRVPYYLGFNYYYFLHDNINGAKYLMEASKLPGSPYYLASLAARLSVYSFQHRVGILFLEELLKSATDQRAIEEFRLRIETMKIMDQLEQTIALFEKKYHRLPGTLEELVETGMLEGIPHDPYGGTFVMLKNGRVYTTSKMLKVKKEHTNDNIKEGQ